MRLDALRRRRITAGAVLICAAVWLAAGLKRTEGDEQAAVLDSRLGLIAPRLADPGWHLVLPGLVRLSLYPVRSATLELDAARGGQSLVTREGTEVQVDLTLRYRVDADRVLDVHRTLGPRFESQALPDWAHETLVDVLAGARYADVSGAHIDELQTEVSRALTERFRGAGLILLSCDIGGVRLSRPAGPAEVLRAASPGRVLLIGLDGADWNIVDPLLAAGKMPHLAKLIREGVRARMRTIAPMLSPVVWTSMATGVVPARHGILDFVATTDREGERVPVASTQRRVKAIWTILSGSGVRVGIVGWWATWPAEPVDGFIVSDRVAYQIFGARPAAERDRAGKVHPAEADDLVVSQTVAPEAVQPADLEPFMRLPADTTDLPPAQARMVDDFKTLYASGKTYVGAAAALAARYHPEFTSVYLEGTDTVGHLFMPYAPPPLAGVDPQSRQRFGHVVDAYYEHVDELMGRLLEAIAPTTIIVVSDHGFRTGDNRPLTESRIGYGAAADWHRKYGIIVLSGPPFRRGVSLEEASVLDLTPTLLRVFSLPVGEDMDGRPFNEAFDPTWSAAHPERYIPSWEAIGGAAAPTSSGSAPVASGDTEGDEERLRKLRELGYIGGGPPGAPAAGSGAVGGAPPPGGAGGETTRPPRAARPVLPPETANAHNNRGTILLGEARYDEAIREFEQAIAASEDLSIARINLARAWYLKKDPGRAEQILREHLARQPRSKEAENLLGNIAMDRGQLAEAEAHFRTALEYEPNFTDARNSLGLLFEKQGRHEEALTQFRKVVAVDADYAEGYNNIGIIQKNAGRIDEAIASFQKAVAADPEFAGSYSNLALIYEDRGDYAAAEQQFRSALRRDPGNVPVRTNLGGLLYLQGRLDEARRELEKAIAADPSYASAYNNLGAVLGKLGLRREEISAYRRAVAINPTYADVHHNLGLTLLQSGAVVEGREEMRRALAIDPHYAPAYMNLGRYLLDAKQLGEAVDLLKIGVGEVPDDPRLKVLLGESLVASGLRDEGLAQYQEALRLKPGDRAILQQIEALRSSETPPAQAGHP